MSNPSGLINVGNSCYLSSVLQLLASADDLLTEHFEYAGNVGRELASVLKEINFSGKRVVNPGRFIRSFAVGGLSPEQQDAHEFLLVLLNLKQVELINKSKRVAGFNDFEKDRVPDDFKLFRTRNVFTGIILNKIICLPCASKRKLRHISSLRVEPFSCLTLTLDDEDGTVNETLYRQFCAPERIGDYINYNLGGNRCGVGAVNQRTPLILPRLLFLHLSLLTSSQSLLKSSDQLITQLELSGPGYRFKLLAVIVHYGSTGNSGHFACYRRDLKGKRWLECNDSRVKVVNEEIVLNQRPYILLYEYQ